MAAVVINACFGNMHDQTAILAQAASVTEAGGRVIISHPLGRAFVAALRDQDPTIVPHDLPTREALERMIQFLPLEIADFTDDADFYMAVLRVKPYRAMTPVIHLRGPVGEGFGRGSRKLGFPTANLRESLFGEALQQVEAGVYFGWARVTEAGKEQDPGYGHVHKAVANVGFSPTFQGAENPEKIVEAHLMCAEGQSFEADFYGSTMALTLVGFQRFERKFNSFPALVARITQDVEDARVALDESEFATFRADGWLSTEPPAGSDNDAQWEFLDFEGAV